MKISFAKKNKTSNLRILHTLETVVSYNFTARALSLIRKIRVDSNTATITGSRMKLSISINVVRVADNVQPSIKFIPRKDTQTGNCQTQNNAAVWALIGS